MTRSASFLPIVVFGLLGLSLAGCSSVPKMNSATAPATVTSAAEVEAIARHLDLGEIKEARRRLDAALRSDPMNPSLLVLHQSVIGDARADLGPSSYSYTIADGDTIAGLAQRFLGNRLKSFQLARYNGIANPAALVPGQVIQIPGRPDGAEAIGRTGSGGRSRGNNTAIAAPATQPRPMPSRAAAPIPSATDAAGARRARTAGLAALNRGDVAHAVTLLQRAAALDPNNDAIAGDLKRARRIAVTVQAQR